jgi:hypothetical protein
MKPLPPKMMMFMVFLYGVAEVV